MTSAVNKFASQESAVQVVSAHTQSSHTLASQQFNILNSDGTLSKMTNNIYLPRNILQSLPEGSSIIVNNNDNIDEDQPMNEDQSMELVNLDDYYNYSNVGAADALKIDPIDYIAEEPTIDIQCKRIKHTK